MMGTRRMGHYRYHGRDRGPARGQTRDRTNYRGFVFERRAKREESADGNRAYGRRYSVHRERVFTRSTRDQRFIKICHVSGTAYARRRRYFGRDVYRRIRRKDRMAWSSIVQVNEDAGSRNGGRGSCL